jgi:ABC-type spermidine/putrescine transport system permease subunit II
MSARLVGWAVLVGLLAPVLHTAWVSFSPDSFLTPPADDWSLRWYRAFAEDRRWTAAVARSLMVATCAGVLSVLAAAPAAYAIRHERFVGRKLLAAGVLLPACLPPAALGMGVLPLMHAIGLWGSLVGIVLVHATLGLPVAFLIVRSHLTEQIHQLESAARGLGASPSQTLRRVTLPLLRPALVAAGVAVFVLSLNESLVTLFLATPSTETVPAVTWPQLRYSPTPLVAVASGVTAVVGAVGIWIVFRVARPMK